MSDAYVTPGWRSRDRLDDYWPGDDDEPETAPVVVSVELVDCAMCGRLCVDGLCHRCDSGWARIEGRDPTW